MKDKKYLSVIVPAYNAEKCIEDCISKLLSYLDTLPFSAELVVMDDGSSDRTYALASAMSMSDYRLKVYKNDENRGKGYTVGNGFKKATGKYLIFIDVDQAYPASEISSILKVLEDGADVAVACRVLPESRYEISPAFFRYLYTRHLMGRFFNMLVRWFLIPGIYDTQAGLKGFTRETADRILPYQTLTGFSFDVELLYLARKFGFAIKQVPINFRYFFEETTVRFFSDTMKMLRDLASIKIKDWRGRYAFKEVIVNADDFGISCGVNQGIVKAYNDGIVRSTSLMMNMPAHEEAIESARGCSDLKVGVHLTLTCGRPLLPSDEIRSLVSRGGNFFSLGEFFRRMITGRIDLNEVEKEYSAQIEKALGCVEALSHLDTHHHVHFYPSLNRIVCKLARKYGIARVRGSSASMLRGFYRCGRMYLDPKTYTSFAKVSVLSGLAKLSGREANAGDLIGVSYVCRGRYQNALEHFIECARDGFTEIVCHPGFVDDELRKHDNWTEMREEELTALTSEKTIDHVRKLKVKI